MSLKKKKKNHEVSEKQWNNAFCARVWEEMILDTDVCV